MKKQRAKEPVRLRERKLRNGNITLYLDYYNAGERQYEYLKLYLLAKPKNALEKKANQEVLELAQRIKAKRIEEALSGSLDLQSVHIGIYSFFALPG